MKNSILIKLFSKVYILFEKQFRKATQSKAGNKPYIAIQTSLFNNSLCIQHTFKIYTHNISIRFCLIHVFIFNFLFYIYVYTFHMCLYLMHNIYVFSMPDFNKYVYIFFICVFV